MNSVHAVSCKQSDHNKHMKTHYTSTTCAIDWASFILLRIFYIPLKTWQKVLLRKRVFGPVIFVKKILFFRKREKSTNWTLENPCSISKFQEKFNFENWTWLNFNSNINREFSMYALCLLTKTSNVHICECVTIRATNTLNALLLSISWNSLFVCAYEMNEQSTIS